MTTSLQFDDLEDMEMPCAPTDLPIIEGGRLPLSSLAHMESEQVAECLLHVSTVARVWVGISIDELMKLYSKANPTTAPRYGVRGFNRGLRRLEDGNYVRFDDDKVYATPTLVKKLLIASQ